MTCDLEGGLSVITLSLHGDLGLLASQTFKSLKLFAPPELETRDESALTSNLKGGS